MRARRGRGRGAAALARAWGAAARWVVLLLVDEREGGGQRHAKFTSSATRWPARAPASRPGGADAPRLPVLRADGGAAPSEARRCRCSPSASRRSTTPPPRSRTGGGSGSKLRWPPRARLFWRRRAAPYILEGDTDAEDLVRGAAARRRPPRRLPRARRFPSARPRCAARSSLTADGHEVVRTAWPIAATARHLAARQRADPAGRATRASAAAAAAPPPPPPGRRARLRRRPPGRGRRPGRPSPSQPRGAAATMAAVTSRRRQSAAPTARRLPRRPTAGGGGGSRKGRRRGGVAAARRPTAADLALAADSRRAAPRAVAPNDLSGEQPFARARSCNCLPGCNGQGDAARARDAVRRPLQWTRRS